MPAFSIIVPAFEAAAHLAECLTSALAQEFGRFEIIVVDDRSVDATFAIAQSFAGDRLRVLRTPANGGPGVARNQGIEAARGEWLVFLDSDDRLAPDALSRLAAFIALPENADLDAVTHGPGARACTKAELLRRSLALQTDGSVIFTAMRRSLLSANGLRFAAGLHEDVDLLFRAHFHARRSGFLDAAIYHKRTRAGSVVETMSPAHIAGFFRAWGAIGRFVRDAAPELLPHWRTGLVGVLATRLREIARLAPDAPGLHGCLHDHWRGMVEEFGAPDLDASATRYHALARAFLAAPGREAMAISAEVRAIGARSWSCTDLHHSVFLAPDQVRTCCKRFFVDGEMRGDVALLDVAAPGDVTGGTILAAKQALHAAINRDDATPCSGCPFLEFRDWGALETLAVRHLSLEYHSVCNLHCGYCSDTYYGGAQPRFDVAALVEGFVADGALAPDATVVWGGGEPTAAKTFAPIIGSLADRLPGLTQRVLTNAVTHSPIVERLLAEGRVSITTSLDAGTAATFARIRGRDRFARVLRHLRRYVAADASAVTIKYIFTQGNATLAECRAFVATMQDEGLLGANCQISRDFKDPGVAEAALLPIVALHGMLVRAGCAVVFFDDLLRQRLVGMDATTMAALRDDLAAEGLHDVLIDAETHPDYAIWGAGWQTRYLMENAAFLRHRKPAFLVDQTPAKIGTRFMGVPVRDPRVLLETDMPVLIAAVQGYTAIRRQFLALGLAESRLVTRLVL